MWFYNIIHDVNLKPENDCSLFKLGYLAREFEFFKPFKLFYIYYMKCIHYRHCFTLSTPIVAMVVVVFFYSLLIRRALCYKLVNPHVAGAKRVKKMTN